MAGALSIGFGLAAMMLALFALALVMERRHLSQRIEAALQKPGPVDADLAEDFVDYAETQRFQTMRALTLPLKQALPAPLRKRLRVKLGSAGLLGTMGEGEYALLRIGCAALGLLAALLIAGWMATNNVRTGPMIALLVAAAGVLLPEYWLLSLANERQRKIRKNLPDVLDLMLVSVEAGTGFDAAVAKVETKFHGPIREEFTRVLQEMRLGKARSAALRDMADRTAVEEMSTLVTAVCQSDQLGVSMGHVLRVQSQTVRQKRLMRIREMAQKLPVKILFPLVFCIFPALFVVILGPAMIKIQETLLR